MTENLPLIPNKQGCVGDVRPVLREVFRERATRLPPLPATQPPPIATTLHRIASGCPCECACDDPKYSWEQEEDLRSERGRLLARASPHHPFKLRDPPAEPAPTTATSHCKLLHRSDLMPRLDQNAARKTTLWIKNILNRSSCDVSELRVSGLRLQPPFSPTPASECRSEQSLSIGKLRIPVSDTETSELISKPKSPVIPKYVVCIPPSLSFVNCPPGLCHTQSVRLVNMSRIEVVLSVRPPARRQLNLQLCGRLKVTAGADTELLVHFKPDDVRTLHDELLVRVSAGRSIIVPISCYIEAPILDVLIPNLESNMLSCALADSKTNVLKQPEVARLQALGAELLDLGAGLLGDVHRSQLVLRCPLGHVSFFIVTEDAWNSQDISDMCRLGSVVAGGVFTVSPAYWRGGGEARGSAWCRALSPGLQHAALRLVCTNAISRPLHLIADALYFYPEHITLQAQEKTYDICSDSDPDCEYYVNLGTTFPHHGLVSSVLILNHSPLTYSYYWSVRAWGKCLCWQEEMVMGTWLGAEDDPERLCPGAREAQARAAARGETSSATSAGTVASARDSNLASLEDAAAAAVRVEPARGTVAPRCSVPLHVAVPDVGDQLGTQRAVLVLVLKNIPRKSLPPGYYPMIVSTDTIQTEQIPGLKSEQRVMYEVVCCQLEVWWHVAPLRFVLDPPFLMLHYSRRVQSVDVDVRATQLFAGGNARVAWRCSRQHAALPTGLELQAERPEFAVVKLPLPELPNEFSTTEIVTLEEERGRWSSRAELVCHCDTRHPALRPVSTWLGVVPPGASMHTTLTLLNDTYQDIYWWGDVHRWLLERWPNEECMSRPKPCKDCKDRSCGCRLLLPTRGFVPRDQSALVQYNATAPDRDGCVVTLFRARRTAADAARLPHAAPVCARAAAICYRVLAPRVTLTVTHCAGESHECDGCAVEECDGALLRPARPLVVGLRTCYRLHLVNHTPIKTHVKWEPPPDGENILRTIFIPTQFDIGEYEEIEIRVVLEARRLCGRRTWVRRALVTHAYEPLYLLIDAGITGLEVEYWLPLPNYSFCLRRKQRETLPDSAPLPKTAEEAFAWEDAKRAVISENLCRCKPHMTWVDPPAPETFAGQDTPPIPVVTSPPPLTRLCKCVVCERPLRPAPEPIALEVRDLPLRTVHTLRVRMRSVCPLAGRWTACARLGSLAPARTLRLGEERWGALVRACGVCVRVSPARGVLGSRAHQDLELRVYADTWGIYREQILILMENLEPLVLNLWVQAVGCPLQFALRPGDYTDNPPLLWVSDPEHTVRAKNTSRAPLRLHAYLLRDHEHKQDAYPFRLCIRLFDVSPPVCSCVYTCDLSKSSVPGESPASPASLPTVSADSMDTGVELYLAPDYGIQDSTYFKVEPSEQCVLPGAAAEWRVRMLPPPPHPPAPAAPAIHPPNHTLLLRLRPLESQGPWWYRGEPAPAPVKIRGTSRAGVLQILHENVFVHLTALDLPYNEVLRVRKRITVQNIGNGPLMISVRVVQETVEQVVEQDKIATDIATEEPGITTEEPAIATEEPGIATEEPGKFSEDYQKVEAERILIDAENTSQAGDIFKLDELETSASIQAAARGGPKWALVRGEPRGVCCQPRPRMPRQQQTELNLPAHSANELCVELSVHSEDAWPPRWEGVKGCTWDAQGVAGGKDEQLPARYQENKTFTSQLQFYDNNNVLKNVPLVLQLQFPHVVATPSDLELGYVCDGDTRKTYFTVSHTCRKETMTVFATWRGGVEFRMHPTCLRLPPGAEQNVYVIYTGRWTGAVAEGWAELRARGAAGAWCCAAVRVRARASRDYKCHLPAHDHTDEPTLLPPDLCLL